jgi:hypothetical protein
VGQAARPAAGSTTTMSLPHLMVALQTMRVVQLVV